VVGAWTHSFWDAWTHPHGWFVQRLPALGAPIAGGVTVVTVLQLGSSVLGAAVLAFLGRRRLRRLRLDWRCGFWLAAVAGATGLACARAVAVHDHSPLFAIITWSVHDVVLIAAAAALAIRVAKLASARASDPS
jgi:hypothetical protein